MRKITNILNQELSEAIIEIMDFYPKNGAEMEVTQERLNEALQKMFNLGLEGTSKEAVDAKDLDGFFPELDKQSLIALRRIKIQRALDVSWNLGNSTEV